MRCKQTDNAPYLCAQMLPYYLPSADYILYCMKSNSWNVPVHMPYDKKLKLNRCLLASSQGPLFLSIPLTGGRNQRGALSDVLIDTNHKWKREHEHSIKTIYGKSPFFIYYFDEIAAQMQSDENRLLTFNCNLINVLLKQLRLDVTLNMDASDQKDMSKVSLSTIRYRQLFEDKAGFLPGCSVIDLLFNHGPDAGRIIKSYL